MAKQRTYFCIDMKTFYASVECAERGYNPFETNLVVADLTRGKNALCLAITPKMKAQGIGCADRGLLCDNQLVHILSPHLACRQQNAVPFQTRLRFGLYWSLYLFS